MSESTDTEFQKTLQSYEPKERDIEDIASDTGSDPSQQEEELADVAAEIEARDAMADDSGVEGSFVTVEEDGKSVVRFVATDDRSLEETREALASTDGRVEFEEVEYGDRAAVIEQFADRYNLPTPPGLPGRKPEDPISELEKITNQLKELEPNPQKED